RRVDGDEGESMRHRLHALRCALALVAAFSASFLLTARTGAVSFPITVEVNGEPAIGMLLATAIPTYRAAMPSQDTIATLLERPPAEQPGSVDGIKLLLHDALDVATSAYTIRRVDGSMSGLWLPSDTGDWIICKDGLVPIVNWSTLEAIGVSN